MFFSVITVCYNEGDKLRGTLESTLSQKCRDYEVILCDGGSSDNTYEIALSYREKFEKLGIPFYARSERDGGVYFGMNHGIEQAAGKYCIFMNGGDRFYDSRCLSAVKPIAQRTGADVVYGDVVRVNGRKREQVICNADETPNCCGLGHQSSYIKTEWLKERGYDTSLSIAADYEYWAYLYSRGAVFRKIHRNLSLFSIGGISSDVSEELRQVETVVERYEPLISLAEEEHRLPFYLYWGKFRQMQPSSRLVAGRKRGLGSRRGVLLFLLSSASPQHLPCHGDS